jgi:ubiquinone/menaquinone biosynthesis C-methylase UbiE
MLRLARKCVGKIIRLSPWLRRQVFASIDYRVVSRDEAMKSESIAGWTSARTARRQADAYERLLRQLHAGEPRVDLAVAAEAVRATGLTRPSILEVGCGGGYYSEIFETLLGGAFDYRGLDYSAAMVESARRRYPLRDFFVGDAYRIDLPDDSADIVFDGVALMHLLDRDKAISESARVARSFCIYHSVPIFDDGPTTYLHKFAYGSPVVEAVFNRDELLRSFDRHGLSVVRQWPSIVYDVYPVTPHHSHSETFLLRVE